MEKVNNIFRNIRILGIAVVLMGLVLMAVFPSNAPYMPEGFFSPVVAFEFIATPQEVQQFFGSPDSPGREEMVRKMDLGNWLDFLFMLLYASFLFFFSIASANKAKSKILYGGAVLAVVVLVGDILENVQLLGITAKLQTGNFERELRLLHIYTWQKWGGITLIFALLIPYFFKGNRFSKIIGSVGFLTCMLAISAYLHRSILNELFVLSVALMFLLMIISCFLGWRGT